jgi:hypothetical protein
MGDLLDALNSKTGLVAALGTVLALAIGAASLVRPSLERRRQQRGRKAQLVLRAPQLGPLSPSSNSRDLRVEIVNVQGSSLVPSVLVRVLSSQPSNSTLATKTQSALTVREHRVELSPGRRDYDTRSRLVGPSLPPLALGPGEAEVIDLTLVSSEPQLYDLQVVVEWFDTLVPQETHSEYSAPQRVEFPERTPRWRPV